MQYAVPLVSWVMCVGVSLYFTLAWSMSGMSTSGPYLNALAYLWAALPALVVSTLVLARRAKATRWLPSAISALPWAAYPWLGVAVTAAKDRQEWLLLGKLLAIAFVACFAAPVVLRTFRLRRGIRNAVVGESGSEPSGDSPARAKSPSGPGSI
jgi:hypothetical protein